MLLYVFPVYVHYDIKVLQVIKNSFFIMVLYPIITFIMIFMAVIVLYLMFQKPSSTLFFSGSAISLIIMYFANLAFQKNDQRLEKSKQ